MQDLNRLGCIASCQCDLGPDRWKRIVLDHCVQREVIAQLVRKLLRLSASPVRASVRAATILTLSPGARVGLQ